MCHWPGLEKPLLALWGLHPLDLHTSFKDSVHLNSSSSFPSLPLLKFVLLFFYFKLLFKDSLTGLRYLQSGLAPDSSALDNWKWDLRLYQGTVPRADNPKRVPLHEYLAPITSSNCLLVGNRNLKIPLLKCTTQRSITSPLSIGSMSRSHSTMTSVKTKVCCPERSPSATSGFYGE